MAYGIDKATLDARSEVLLKEFRMEKRLNWFLHIFQRECVKSYDYVCLLVNPSLYIIDEPFVGLDPLGIQSLLDQMDEKKKKALLY